MLRARFIHLLALTLAPVIVAVGEFSVITAIGLVVLLLAWRWLLTLASISKPPSGPELVLDTISASHFVEKVRWCMDRLGVDYVENASGGTLGAFFTGRTVPRLRFKTGLVESSIGNSAEILRYLWGQYKVPLGTAAAFLEPTKERLEFEQQIDRCGRDLQVWIYYHILPSRELTMQAWGANSSVIPPWQRVVLKTLFPLLRFLIRRAFQINEKRYGKAIQHVGQLLSQSEARLVDQRLSLLGGQELNYTDFSFAAINGLWLLPQGYGGGKAETVRIDSDRLPTAMRRDIESWKSGFPLSTDFISRLYRDERWAAISAPKPGLEPGLGLARNPATMPAAVPKIPENN